MEFDADALQMLPGEESAALAVECTFTCTFTCAVTGHTTV